MRPCEQASCQKHETVYYAFLSRHMFHIWQSKPVFNLVSSANKFSGQTIQLRPVNQPSPLCHRLHAHLGQIYKRTYVCVQLLATQ